MNAFSSLILKNELRRAVNSSLAMWCETAYWANDFLIRLLQLMNERRPTGCKIFILRLPLKGHQLTQYKWKLHENWLHYTNFTFKPLDSNPPPGSEEWLPCRWWATPRGCGLPVAAPARWAAPGPSRRRGSRCLPLWPWAIHRRWRRTSPLSLFSPGRTCSWFAWGRRERSRRGRTAPSALWRHRG